MIDKNKRLIQLKQIKNNVFNEIYRHEEKRRTTNVWNENEITQIKTNK